MHGNSERWTKTTLLCKYTHVLQINKDQRCMGKAMLPPHYDFFFFCIVKQFDLIYDSHEYVHIAWNQILQSPCSCMQCPWTFIWSMVHSNITSTSKIQLVSLICLSGPSILVFNTVMHTCWQSKMMLVAIHVQNLWVLISVIIKHMKSQKPCHPWAIAYMSIIAVLV